MHTYQQSHWQLEAENKELHKQPWLDVVGHKAKEDIGVGKRLVGGRREGERVIYGWVTLQKEHT